MKTAQASGLAVDHLSSTITSMIASLHTEAVLTTFARPRQRSERIKQVSEDVATLATAITVLQRIEDRANA